MILRGIPDPKALVRSIRHKLSLFAFGLRLAFKSTCIYPVTVRGTPCGFNCVLYAAPSPVDESLHNTLITIKRHTSHTD